MKLTVGPLPAGVYWRRRVIVGGATLLAALMLWASCGGGDDSGGKKKTSSAASPRSVASATAEATPSLQVPTTGEPAASSTPTSTVASPTPVSTVPPCADADLSLVASAAQQVQFRGAYLSFMLKIKNTTNHDCVRDVGADFQELYLAVGPVKMWSSDDCNAPHGSKPQTLKPGIEVAFTHDWNGKATSNGCTGKETPPAGKYQLFGRLDTKFSEPVQIQLT
jgi:hypothetical protein